MERGNGSGGVGDDVMYVSYVMVFKVCHMICMVRVIWVCQSV